MKYNLKIIGGKILSILFAVFLTACGSGGGGGGGGGSNGGGGVGNATITGTVAGTVIVAVDENDNEVARVIATGSPKSFTLNVTPGGNYRLYFIENEGTAYERVFSLYQGTTNVFTVSSAVTINLGFVDTSTGVAVPANKPLNISGVTSGGEKKSIPTSLAGSAFTTVDLQGTWNYLGLISGDSPNQTPGWYWGSITNDANGNATFTTPVTDSLGNSNYTPGGKTFNIYSSGIITIPAGTASYRGIMNKYKDIIIATATMAPGGINAVNGYNLQILLKSGGTFATSDLQGTWDGHSLTSGDSPQWNGWGYWTMTFDDKGNGTFTSHTLSNGYPTLPNPVSVSVAPNGIISNVGYPTYHGVMSQDKNMTVVTMDEGGGGYRLFILVRRHACTITASDTQGTFNFHMLTSGDSPQWNGWAYGKAVNDSNGKSTVTSMTRSDGDSTLPGGSNTLSISSDCIMTIPGFPSYHGVISQNGMVIVTMGDGGGGYSFQVVMR